MLLASAFGCGDSNTPEPSAPDSGNPHQDAATLADALSEDVAAADADSSAPDGNADAADVLDGSSHDGNDAAGQALRVLFIGNSYTYVNDLPQQLEQLAANAAQGATIHTESVVAGGATLKIHWEGSAAQPAISKGGWSHVVLQGQSFEPLITPKPFQQYAALFAEAIHDVGATVSFFETWARADGDALYEETWTGGTPDKMQDGLYSAYSQAADAGGGVLVPVGEAWRYVRKHYPSIQLFQSDGSHPAVAGTWLAACVFYRALTSLEVPPSVTPTAGVSPDDTAHLIEAAASVTSVNSRGGTSASR